MSPSPSSRALPPRPRRRRADGFTLVELAIVLLVLGVLARAVLAPFGAGLERRRHDETLQRLAAVRDALVGHLLTRGALPCPLPPGGPPPERLDDTVTGDVGSGTRCRRGHGHVPAAALGVAGAVDASGALLDGWGRPLQYAVSLASDDRAGDPALPDWLVAGEARAVGLDRLAADLSLCRVAVEGRCPSRASRADALVFVVVSTGADATPTGHARENVDGDRVYALAAPSVVPGERFDDLLVWGSRDELAYRLLQAGWLP